MPDIVVGYMMQNTNLYELGLLKVLHYEAISDKFNILALQ
jgi:hypothetical protein